MTFLLRKEERELLSDVVGLILPTFCRATVRLSASKEASKKTTRSTNFSLKKVNLVEKLWP